MFLDAPKRYVLDEKNRVRLPAQMLDELGDGAVMSAGVLGAINIMSKETYAEKHMSLFKKLSIYDAKGQLKTSQLAAQRATLEPDAQGRVTIPQNLKNKFKINKEVVFVGKYDFVEMWPAELYDERVDIFDSDTVSELLSQINDLLDED